MPRSSTANVSKTTSARRSARTKLSIDCQPQFDLETGRLTGYEALVRWWHAQEGEIPPATFVPIAEETGLIATLGEWILRSACRLRHHLAPADTTLAVNLSPAPVKTQDVVALVSRILDETGLEPCRLELEITESILLQNTEVVLDALKRLDRLGVSIAMDDFGTGYSSLSSSHQVSGAEDQDRPLFHRRLGQSPQTRAIVSSIVGLGQDRRTLRSPPRCGDRGPGRDSRNDGAAIRCRGSFYGRPDAEVAESKEAMAGRPRVA